MFKAFIRVGLICSVSCSAMALEGVENNPYQLLQQRYELFQSSQKLMAEFDQKLEVVYQQKLKSPGQVVSTVAFEKERFKLNLAREWSEHSFLHLQNSFAKLLQTAQGEKAATPTEQLKAKLALGMMEAFLGTISKAGDSWAAATLSEELQEITESVLSRTIPQKKSSWAKLDFTKYSLKKASERARSYQESLRMHLKRPPNSLDRQMENLWTEHRKEEFISGFDYDFQPISYQPSFYPSEGENGMVSGNRFPTGAWAITLDDGPHPIHTRRLMSILQAADIPTTFFWLSQNILRYPDVARSARGTAFRRGSHSFTHQNLQAVNERRLTYEIEDAVRAFTSVIGERPVFFRCPYGNCGKPGSRIRHMIAQEKMLAVKWNVDSMDWHDRNPSSIFARVRKQMSVAGGGIILFHDIHPQSVSAVKMLADYIQSNPRLRAYSMDQIMKDQTGLNYSSP